jgi:Uma2 family endonuclease
MAEPAIQVWRETRDDDSGSGESVLLRWVEQPDGRMDLIELPLTPELFLNPQFGDKMNQGRRHDLTGREITDLLEDHFRPQPEVLVLHDMKHLFGPEHPAPVPDVSVVRGARDHDADRESFDAVEEGVLPCLVIEVVSPYSARIRRTDLEAKVRVYEAIGIFEYLIVDSPRWGAGRGYALLGYRLDAEGRYQPIEADAEGRFHSQATDISFQVAPDRQRVLLFESSTGRRLMGLAEWKAIAAREADARQAAEERAASSEHELARLRAEIERLRGGG